MHHIFDGRVGGDLSGIPVRESSLLRPLHMMVGIDPHRRGDSNPVLYVGDIRWFKCRIDIAQDRREIFNRLRDDLGLART